jgi:hypothetical protein
LDVRVRYRDGIRQRLRVPVARADVRTCGFGTRVRVQQHLGRTRILTVPNDLGRDYYVCRAGTAFLLDLDCSECGREVFDVYLSGTWAATLGLESNKEGTFLRTTVCEAASA